MGPGRSIAGVMLAFVACAGDARALGVDEVVERYVQAHGGAERWRALESMEWSGSYVTFSKAAPCTMLRKRPNLQLFEYSLNGHPAASAYDGETAWWISPLMDEVAEAPPAEARAIESDSEFDSALLDWREKGHRVELLGQEQLEGQPTYKLQVTRKNGSVETWYLDTTTFLELARQAPGSDFGQELPRWIWYSDFRDVAGIKLPHHIETEYGMRHAVLQIERVRTGVAIDAARFRMPPPKGMDRLAGLVGEWDLKVETRDDPRLPWTTVQARSAVQGLVGGGMLLERLSYETPTGGRTELVRALSYDRFRKRYRLTEYDTSTKYPNVLEGGAMGDDGRLVLSNKETGTTWSGFGMTFTGRVVAYDLGPDGFKIDNDLSTDGGENWMTTARFTYTRPPS